MTRKKLYKVLAGISIEDQKEEIIELYDSLIIKTINKAEKYFRKRQKHISTRIINEVLREGLADFDTEIEAMWSRLQQDYEYQLVNMCIQDTIVIKGRYYTSTLTINDICFLVDFDYKMSLHFKGRKW